MTRRRRPSADNQDDWGPGHWEQWFSKSTPNDEPEWEDDEVGTPHSSLPSGSSALYPPDTEAEIPVERWFYDAEGYYAYLLIDGNETTRNLVRRSLEKNGILVRAVGKSHRPASNGEQYDWYLRFGDPSSGDRETLLELLRDTLGGLLVWEEQALQARIDTLETRLEDALSTIDALRRESEQLHSARRKALEEVDSAERDRGNATIALARAERESARLQRAVEERDHQLQRARDRITDVEARKADAEEFAAFADSQVGEQDSALEAYARQVEQYQTEIAALRRELAATKAHAAELERRSSATAVSTEVTGRKARAVSGRATPRDYLSKVLTVLLPQTTLLRQSVDMLHTDFENPSHVLRDLLDVDRFGKISTRAKKLADAEGWFETRFSTGANTRNAFGRLYFRVDGDRRWALISTKDDQDHDIRWLRTKAHLECV